MTDSRSTFLSFAHRKPLNQLSSTLLGFSFALARLFVVCGLLISVLGSPAIAAPFKVAFTGDQSVGENARAVLELIAEENTDLLLIQGDLGYGLSAAAAWESNLNASFGEDFPVLVVVGNHENYEWPIYRMLTERRMARVDGLRCEGDTGVKAFCQMGPLDIVQVSPGIYEVDGVNGDDDYANYIRSKFAGPTDRWRICTWHKNQNSMQTGNKGNSTGWAVYDACLDAGAMIIVAHEHAYSRTHLMSDFENLEVVHRRSEMSLRSGQSFVAVSGLGGREVRPQVLDGDWWASIYTSTQGATHGALFCSFEDLTADCYFKAIDGAVPDRFTLRLDGVGIAPPAPAPPPTAEAGTESDSEPEPVISAAGYVFARSDKDEYRWIGPTESGETGNIWIDKACAQSLGGAETSGDWGDLVDLAPMMDSIENPCAVANTSLIEDTSSDISAIDASDSDSGFVFSRTDKVEYRWIERTASGVLGNIWIDEACAERLGGRTGGRLGDDTASGDWGDLFRLAPLMDAVESPCSEESAATSGESESAQATSAGFVFSRVDTDEFRWIAPNVNGIMSSIWIDTYCVERLGGVSVTGDWQDLEIMAPGFDELVSPCY